MMGGIIWMTGLPCSGKTTIARIVQRRAMRHVVILDGDEVRQELCADLGFSPADRRRNLERVAAVARLLTAQGCTVICCFVSPTEAVRARVRELLPNLVEVFVDTPLEECIRRDVKGMYAEALAGERPHFTGVGAPYEPPAAADIILDTTAESPEATAERLLCLLWSYHIV